MSSVYVENAQFHYKFTKRLFFYRSTKIYIKEHEKRLIMLITRLITHIFEKKRIKKYVNNLSYTQLCQYWSKKGKRYNIV